MATDKKSIISPKAKTILGRVILAVEVLLLIFAILLTVTVIISTQNEDKIPKAFGKSLLTVQSDSMKPKFSKGALVYAEELTDDYQIKVGQTDGDIVAYWGYIDKNGTKMPAIIIHRVVGVNSLGKYITRGDNNPTDDSGSIARGDILAVYQGHIGGIGGFLDFFKDPVMFGVFVVAPLILLFVYNVYSLIRIYMNYRVSKATVRDLSEEDKAKIIAEYMAKQAEQKSTDDTTQKSEEDTKE